jgi:hypothetical protein
MRLKNIISFSKQHASTETSTVHTNTSRGLNFCSKSIFPPPNMHTFCMISPPPLSLFFLSPFFIFFIQRHQQLLTVLHILNYIPPYKVLSDNPCWPRTEHFIQFVKFLNTTYCTYKILFYSKLPARDAWTVNHALHKWLQV